MRKLLSAPKSRFGNLSTESVNAPEAETCSRTGISHFEAQKSLVLGRKLYFLSWGRCAVSHRLAFLFFRPAARELIASLTRRSDHCIGTITEILLIQTSLVTRSVCMTCSRCVWSKAYTVHDELQNNAALCANLLRVSNVPATIIIARI